MNPPIRGSAAIAFVTLAMTVAAMFCGCETPGHSLAESAVGQIRDGQSTRAEIDRVFGEPSQVTSSPDGRTLYLYQRYYGPDQFDPNGFAVPRRDEANLILLSVLFSPAGTVEKHLRSHTRPSIDRIQLSTGRKFSPEALARISPGKTTRADLTGWFGAQWSEQLTLSGHRLALWFHADAYNLSNGVETQALEVVMDDAGNVHTYRVTKHNPWKN